MKSIQIRRFRMLEAVDIRGLGQMNLIVGKNNAGKSTLLEAVHIFARRGSPNTLLEVLGYRDETTAARLVDAEESLGENAALRQLFSGREFPEGDETPIVIGDEESGEEVSINYAFFKFIDIESPDEDGDLVLIKKRVPVSRAALATESTALQTLVMKSGSRTSYLNLEESMAARRLRSFGTERGVIPVNVLSTRFLHPDRLAALWDQAVLINAGDAVVNGLKLIEPGIQGLAFVKSDQADRPYRTQRDDLNIRAERIAMVRLKGIARPIPLGSMGDGMLRVLQLLLAMYPAKGGYFLIDEFENGLHHSVQDGVWELLFTLAKKLNVQVFATTHSNDCIASFARIAEKHKDIAGSLTRLKRITTDVGEQQVVATAFLEPELLMAQEAHIDLR